MSAIRPATAGDAERWLELRAALWPESPMAEHREEIRQYFAGEFPRWPWVTLLATEPDGRIVGFAEVSTRPYAQGCESHPVAYLEGWYVAEPARRRGHGRALVEAAEAWGRGRGCTEFASDADPDNDVSRAAHGAAGFSEVGLVRCFRKDL